MRPLLKSILNRLSLRLIWQRITFSKISVAFFLVALVHCVIQVALQAHAVDLNDAALDFLEDIVAAGVGNGSVPTGVAIFNTAAGTLSLCDGVPIPANCHVIWRANDHDADDLPDSSPTVPPGASPVGASRATTAASTSSSSPISVAAPTPARPFTTAAQPTPVFPLNPGVVQISPGFAATTAIPALSNQVGGAPIRVIDGGGASTAVVDAGTPVDDGSSDSDPVEGGSSDNDSDDAVAVILKKRAVEVTFTPEVDEHGQVVGVLVVDPLLEDGQLFATPTCIASLLVPIQSLRDSRRVDLTFIAFQTWVLGMSVVALLNESVPHILASLLTHLLATVWSSYQVRMTQDFHAAVTSLIVHGPCKANLLPHFWNFRLGVEIAIAVLNAVVLIAIGFLSFRLIKSFGWQTFKRVGASFVINRAYRLVLAFSIVIQLSVFFMGANLVLWIDQLYNGTIAKYAYRRAGYEVASIIVLGLLLPWLTMGWFAVRRESRWWMHVFIALGGVMIGGWTLMFVSTSFRWTFEMWIFFAAMTVVAAVLLVCTTAMAVWCRLNFGRGLPRYLHSDAGHTDEQASDDLDRSSVNSEDKAVEFPSRDGSPVPTFQAAFGDTAPVLQRLGALPGTSVFSHAQAPATSYAHTHSHSHGHANSHSRTHSDDGAPGATELRRGPSSSSHGSGPNRDMQPHTEAVLRGKRWLIE